MVKKMEWLEDEVDLCICFSKEHHLLGGHGIVGGQIGIGTGSGFTSKYLKEQGKNKDYNITLTYFGDGAIHQGIFHESLNIAKSWNLPVLYILENNGFAMGTSTKRANSTGDDFSKKSVGYGIDYIKVNGMDVLEVYEKTKEIVDKMRIDGKPRFMEIVTYRYKGHSASDPQTYRTRADIDQHRKNDDPIINFKKKLIEEDIITEEDFDTFKKESKLIVNDATNFADKCAEPEASTLLKYNII